MSHADTPPKNGRILQLAYLPNGSFVLQVLGRLHASKNPRVKALATVWVKEGLGDLASSVSTKVSMLSLLAERLSGSTTPLILELLGDANAQAAYVERRSWVPRDRQLPFRVLLDVDSFIFEFRSAYEILGKFLGRFFELILNQRIKELEIKARLQADGVDMTWADQLQAHRKDFFHGQAPWLAVRITDETTFAPELLILSHAGANPADAEAVIPFTRLLEIYAGMDASLRRLYEWLIVEIECLESRVWPRHSHAR